MSQSTQMRTAEKNDEHWMKFMRENNQQSATGLFEQGTMAAINRALEYSTIEDRFCRVSPYAIALVYIRNLITSRLPVDSTKTNEESDEFFQIDTENGVFGNMKLRQGKEFEDTIKNLEGKKRDKKKPLAGVLYVQGACDVDYELIERESGAILVGCATPRNHGPRHGLKYAESSAALVKHDIVGFALDDHTTRSVDESAEYYEVCTCLTEPSGKVITAKNVFDLIMICKAITPKSNEQRLLDGFNPRDDPNVPSTSSYVPAHVPDTSEEASSSDKMEVDVETTKSMENMEDDVETLLPMEDMDVDESDEFRVFMTRPRVPKPFITNIKLKENAVLVFMGLGTLEFDRALFELAKKMSRKTPSTYNIQYFFGVKLENENKIEELLGKDDTYNPTKRAGRMYQAVSAEEKLDPCDTLMWQYALAPYLSIYQYPKNVTYYGICHWITFPMKGVEKKSIQIFRKNTPTTSLTHFAKEVYGVMHGNINYEAVAQPENLD